MLEGGRGLTISAAFDQLDDNGTSELYRDVVLRTLPKLLSADFLDTLTRLDLSQEEKLRCWEDKLPLMYSSKAHRVPFNKSFFILSRYRPHSFKFFIDIISRWLIPGKRLNVVLIHASDFRVGEIGSDVYTLCEVMIRVESAEDLLAILSNFSIIKSEVCLGVESAYYARRILELKGLAVEEKTAQIQEHIAYLIKRVPKSFDSDVLTEMQHMLVTCRDEFKELRDVHHLSRLISVNYLFRRMLRSLIVKSPHRRHLLLKLMHSKLRHPVSPKRVLGLVIGVNFLRDKEVFEERHIMKALQNHLSGIQSLEGSFISSRRGLENVATLYIEIEKSDGTDFTLEEVKRLRLALPSDLKQRIEHPMHPVFNPRNEEEIMRYVLALTNQIKYVRDIPQVFISFDEQSYTHLFFTVILVRVLKEQSLSIEEMLRHGRSSLSYHHDRCRTVGMIRKRYPKEATIFRVKLEKEEFLRHDHSIDLRKARQHVVSELVRVVGEIRDYNGGIISKQNELFHTLRQLVQKTGRVDHVLLENFFYSLMPVIMRSVMEPSALEALYVMMVSALDKGINSEEPVRLTFQEDVEFLYAVAIFNDPRMNDSLFEALGALHIATTSLATARVMVLDVPCVGYIYRSSHAEQRETFRQALQNAAFRAAADSQQLLLT